MTEHLLAFEPIPSLAARFRTGELSPVELTERLLDRIQALDGSLHAFIRVTRERALDEARAAEAELRAGHDRGTLHGIPYAVKDLFDVKGEPTTAGTRMLAGNVAERDCTAIDRLAQAGMVLIGKTHTVQFALGPVGINSDYGTPHNPWHPTPHAPGGSSSGSAVAVAAGMVPIALGSDTGGSVRIPAALCGAVGLKTTVGRVSRAGVYPLSWTFDTVGPLTRSVEAAALAYQALQGTDVADETTIGVAAYDVLPSLTAGVDGLRLGVCETVMFDDLSAEVAQAVRAALKVLSQLGARVESLKLPELADAFVDPDRLYLQTVEACHYHARFLDEHFQEMDPLVRNRMIQGRELSAPNYFGALRRMAYRRARLLERLRDVDALLAPSVLTAAEPIAEFGDLERYQRLAPRYSRNTSLCNYFNLCAVSVPCGFSAEGLPIGLMVHAKPFEEAIALRVAHAFEQATDWHRRLPDLSWAHQR